VPFVGDSEGDILAARAAGARPILVLTGNGESTKTKQSAENVPVYKNLAEFARTIIGHDQRPHTA
ncbi:MAG TPA: HAD hydrolase-like protein, partial [Nevskia sp.]|nr:HAD hydrolase-like protein [Nevskia sp.]